MDVYMENKKKTNSADDAEIHRYKRPTEGFEHLHELRHGRRCGLRFFSRSSSEVLLEVVDKYGKTACSTSGWSNNGDGLVVGWPKLTKGNTRTVALLSLKTGEARQWRHRRWVSLFIAQRKCNGHPNRLR
jgi:hypothetical protein